MNFQLNPSQTRSCRCSRLKCNFMHRRRILWPYSWLLISNKFCNGGGGERPEQGEQVPLCTCSSNPPPLVWALKPPLALVHKTTYAPMIYTDLCIMFWMRAYPFLGQVGGGWALEFSSYLGPKLHLPIDSMPFPRGPKTLELLGPTPSHLPL